MNEFKIGNRIVGDNRPTYFIADIASNHDGDLERAKELIHLAADAGADAAKFQNFRADQLVSDRGFRGLGTHGSHQTKWKKSVFEIYRDASIPWEWTPILRAECDRAGISYSSTPYDLGAVDMLDPYVAAFKIGSGDLTWHEICLHIARKAKPVILATGASEIGEVQGVVCKLLALNPQLALLQCNTNYTGSLENFGHVHLRVLNTFRVMFPQVVLGLSDHTLGHSAVLGAVALGGRVIEKHFTTDTSREGPDHPFSMTHKTWREMVDRTRELEAALGHATKEIAGNEHETVVVQRRSIRAARDLAMGVVLSRTDLELLRPAPAGSLPPFEIDRVVGRTLAHDLKAGDHLTFFDLKG